MQDWDCVSSIGYGCLYSVEGTSVGNHFKNGKSLIEIAEIIKRSHSALQHVVKSYKKENRFTGKVRKSAKESCTA